MSNCHLALTDSLKFSVVNRLKTRATFPLQSTPESRAKLSRNATRTNRCTHLETGVGTYSSAETCLREITILSANLPNITHALQFGENTFTINPAFTGKFHRKML
jgi:hypothetical protein